MLMKLNHNGEVITLNENEQAEVYEFYRLHSTMDRLVDVLGERDSLMKFTLIQRITSSKSSLKMAVLM